MIPLDFWFCKNTNLALPLIAMQYTFSKLNFTFSKFNDLFKIGNPFVSYDELMNSEESSLSYDNLIIKRFIIALNNDSNTSFTSQNLLSLFTSAHDKYINSLDDTTKQINDDQNDLNDRIKTRSRMINVLEEKNIYKQKVIFTLVSLIFFLIIMIIFVYVFLSKR